MNLVDLSSIIVPEGRQRQAFNEKALDDLQSTVERFLLHPPTVRSETDLTLVAGERRLRVLRRMYDVGIPCTHMGQTLPLGKVPVLFFNNDDTTALFEAELVENIHRDDLAWQEKAMAVAKLHQMRTEEAAARGEAHTLKATANEVFKGTATEHEERTVRDAVSLGKAIENDFELAMAKSESDAMKIIKKRDEASRRKLLAATVDMTQIEHTLTKGDSFALIDTLPAESIHVVVTDPPYGADMHEKGTHSVDEHNYDDSGAFVQKMIDALPDKLFRVMAKDSHGYMFCDFRYFTQWKMALAFAGFRVWQRPLIWYKGSIGAFVDAKHGPRYTHEYLIYFLKGDRHIDVIYDDVITAQQSSHNDHPAGKPAKLFEILLKHSGVPGETCLDLFAGSGPIFEAAHACKMKAIGFELNDAYFDMALARIAGLKPTK